MGRSEGIQKPLPGAVVSRPGLHQPTTKNKSLLNGRAVEALAQAALDPALKALQQHNQGLQKATDEKRLEKVMELPGLHLNAGNDVEMQASSTDKQKAFEADVMAKIQDTKDQIAKVFEGMIAEKNKLFMAVMLRVMQSSLELNLELLEEMLIYHKVIENLPENIRDLFNITTVLLIRCIADFQQNQGCSFAELLVSANKRQEAPALFQKMCSVGDEALRTQALSHLMQLSESMAIQNRLISYFKMFVDASIQKVNPQELEAFNQKLIEVNQVCVDIGLSLAGYAKEL